MSFLLECRMGGLGVRTRMTPYVRICRWNLYIPFVSAAAPPCIEMRFGVVPHIIQLKRLKIVEYPVGLGGCTE